MLIGHCEELVDWINLRIEGSYRFPDVVTFGYVKNGEITAGCIFSKYTKSNVEIALAIDGGIFPKGLIALGFRYAFNQLAVCRLTFLVKTTNIKSIKLVEKLGAYREATLPDVWPDCGLAIYCLRPENSSIWKKLNGKKC